MKLNTTLVLIALAFAGASASAATLGSLRSPADGSALGPDPTVGPGGAAAHGDFQVSGPVDDVYNFQIADLSDLLVIANEYEGQHVQLAPADFTLYRGTSAGESGTLANKVGSVFSFTGGPVVTTIFANVGAGSYFFEITGQATKSLGADYDVEIDANTPANPLPSVPEPANMALLLGGLGLVGFMAKRRLRD